MKAILILGSGYTGKKLRDRIRGEATEIFETSRSHGPIRFDLNDDATWKNLPKVDGTFWMFPPVPTDKTREFLSKTADRLGRMVVVGTTSSFQVTHEDQEVSEESVLQSTDARVLGEEELRRDGASIVRSAGIYGPGRNPLDWLRAGRISDFSKFVNFIHVEDLVEILWATMLKGRPGAQYLAADSQPHRWSELKSSWERDFNLKFPSPSAAGSLQRSISKRVNATATLKEFGLSLKFASVVDGIRVL